MQDKAKYNYFEVQQQFCDFTLFNNRQHSDQSQDFNKSNNKFWFRKKKKEVSEEEKKEDESEDKIKSDETSQNRLKSPSHMEVRDSNEKFWFRLKSKYMKSENDSNNQKKEQIEGKINGKNLSPKVTKGNTKGHNENKDKERINIKIKEKNNYEAEGYDEEKGWKRMKDRMSNRMNGNGNGKNDDFANRVNGKDRNIDKGDIEIINEKTSSPLNPKNHPYPKPTSPIIPEFPKPAKLISPSPSLNLKLTSSKISNRNNLDNEKVLQMTDNSTPSTPSSNPIQSSTSKKTLNINQVALIDIPSKSKNASSASFSSGLEIHPQSGFHISTPKSNRVFSMTSKSRPSIAIQTAPSSTKNEKRPQNESKLRRDSKQGTIISVISLHCKRLEGLMESKFSKLNKNLDYIDARIKQARKMLEAKKNESFSSDDSKSKSLELIRKFHRSSLNPVVMAHSSRTVDKLTAAWADVLYIIKSGKICEGFNKCLDMEDDLYLLRLLHLFGPCFKFIPQAVCVRVMAKLVEIIESRFVEEMASEWIGQDKI